ncbi:ThiF family adenylyltransferase [uncultured Psychroserpens sp.]|uniref:ThiF family adenylyltransferase n=1 Tax=uncultured Psychroserpens sp. TaxID=255436 RepID=UPI002608AF37|nr:ThiF family adenylyltransferase [uncultured Psychroserpens sp.]
MSNKALIVNDIFTQFSEDLKITEHFQFSGDELQGEIEVLCNSKPNIKFKVQINNIYPLKNGDLETIRFVNKELLKYSHLNKDGSICFTSLTSPTLEYKLECDVKAMLEWVDKYYIQELDDGHFEYLLHNSIDMNSVFLFSDLDKHLDYNDFGLAFYSKHSQSDIKKTYLLQGLKSRLNNEKASFNWSSGYNNPAQIFKGLYYISNSSPTSLRNFAFENWQDFEQTLRPEFLKLLNDIRRHIDKKYLLDGKYIILFYGYPMPNGRFNFESIKINVSEIPLIKNGYIDQEIIWAKTVDSSYDIFFGRGKLSDDFTDKKIMILGVGALGSILAEAMVRGGCRQITIVDADMKEVGNICRSNYNFLSGEKLKVDELRFNLMSISPFVEIACLPNFLLPSNLSDKKNGKDDTAGFLNDYDYVFNCTASNDVSIIIDRLELMTNVTSISISNHANELFCYIGSKNIYNTTSEVFSKIKQDMSDVFNPQGCWSPTFKASYHNISALVNFALSNIDYKLKTGKILTSFLLEVDKSDNYTIKLKD